MGQWAEYLHSTRPSLPAGLENSLPTEFFLSARFLPLIDFPHPSPPLHSSSDVTHLLFVDWPWAWGGKEGQVGGREVEGGGPHTRA